MVSGVLCMFINPLFNSRQPCLHTAGRTNLSLAARLKTLEIGNFKQLNSIRVLVLAIYSCTLAFIFTGGLLINAWDFTTEDRRGCPSCKKKEEMDAKGATIAEPTKEPGPAPVKGLSRCH